MGRDRDKRPVESDHVPLTSREARVVPAADELVVDKVGQLALRHGRVDHVEASKGPDLRAAQAKRLADPLVLHVALVVLGCAQRVRDPLDAVHNWAGKVIGRVNLVLGAGAEGGGKGGGGDKGKSALDFSGAWTRTNRGWGSGLQRYMVGSRMQPLPAL